MPFNADARTAVPITNDFNIPRLITAVILSIGLAFHGYSKKSLNINGAISALLVGFTSFAVSTRFGIILILFYYTSSKLTKLKEAVKAKLEDEYVSGGQRGCTQVLACSFLGTIVCILFYAYVGEDCHVDFTGDSSVTTMDFLPFQVRRNHAAAYLWSMYIAHYSCATADTWASEVGILSKERPRLITSLLLRDVPHGTNGGVSILGTLASMAGGAFIGFIFWILSFPHSSDPEGHHVQYPMILVGMFCGFFGSLIDSILGATVQATYYSTDKKCIVKKLKIVNGSVCMTGIDRICGLDILSNEAVNFLSTFLTMVLSIWLGPAIFCFCDSNQCK